MPTLRCTRSHRQPRRPGFTVTVLAALALALPASMAVAPHAWAQQAPAASAPAPSLRPAVAKPLQAAQAALQAGNAKEALVRLAEAEAMPDLQPYETYILRRLKAPALFNAGELAAALAVFETLVPMAELPAADRLTVQETSVKLAVQLKEYPRAVALMRPYLAAGGADTDLKRLYPQLLAVTQDHAGAVREASALVAADEAAGRAAPEPLLRLLASSQDTVGDKAGYLRTLERLAASTGKPEYWGELVQRTTRRPGFAEERLRLDLYRLRLAAGLALQPGEWADMGQRALLAGLPGEAKAVLDEGFAKNLLGNGADAAADRKLRDQAHKAAAQDLATLADSEASARQAKDGNVLVSLGQAVSGAGQHERGLALLAAGVAKGGLRRPDEALLHLAVAQQRAGKTAEALKTLAEVNGPDGSADLARLWTLLLKNPPRAK